MSNRHTLSNRRALLQFLAASPLLAELAPFGRAFAQDTDNLVSNAADALDVFDLEAVARKVLPPAHWGYLASGVDGEVTLRANRAGFARYELRTRRFVDVSHMDLSTEVFGMKLASPVFLCPVGAQGAFHPEAEVAVARAAGKKGNLQILSTVTSKPVEDVAKAHGSPIWYQLYTTDDFAVTTRLVKRAEAAGCPVVAVTVDLPAGRNTETVTRFRRLDSRPCGACHEADAAGNPSASPANLPMFAGIDTKRLRTTSPSLTWDFIGRLKGVTKMKVVIKGLESGDDAALAVKYGADGIVVSNHGGRASETGRPTIESLPEVVQAVSGRIPVLVDGGFRRGTDVLKALALGAAAVGVGRPYIWGLAAFGELGVARVIDILNNELRLAMVACGARSIKEITHAALIDTERRA